MSTSVNAKTPTEPKLISRTSMLILGGFLIGITYAHALQDGLRSYVFLAGAFGLVAYIGLNYIAHMRAKRVAQRRMTERVAKLEQRFDQHLAAESPVVESPVARAAPKSDTPREDSVQA